MKEYIRSTHNFNNETREWEYRGDIGGDKREQWKFDRRIRELGPSWSISVHSLENDRWKYMRSIIDDTIKMYNSYVTDGTELFKEFVKNNPNHREIIKRDILKEFEILIELDMIRVRDNGQQFDTDYWER